LDQSVDLPACRGAQVADTNKAGGPCGVAGVLEAVERIADHPDAAAPLSVQELRPGQLLRLLADDARVVAERIEIEGRVDARAEARLRSDGPARPLVRPFDQQAFELARRADRALPAPRAVGGQGKPAGSGASPAVGAE